MTIKKYLPSEIPVIQKSGFLMKRGFVNTAFQLRWFVVEAPYLVFYKKISDKERRGSMCCVGASVDRRRGDALNPNTPFAFNVTTPYDQNHPKIWVLQATSAEERDEWMRIIMTIASFYTPHENALIRGSISSPSTTYAAGKAAGCNIS